MRIGAARLVLSDQAGTAMHKAVSKMQAAALVSMVKTAVLTDDEKADVSSLIVALSWFCPEDCSAVVDAMVAKGSAGEAAGKKRRGLQDYTAFLGYGHADFWKLMANPSVPPASKLTSLCQWLLKLGLRLPSEHTIKLVTSFWMMQVHSAESLATLTVEQKIVYLRHVKVTFDNLRKQAGDPHSWIDRLPTEPLEMCQSHPTMFNAAFGEKSLPIVSPVDLSAVVAIDQSYGCRGGARKNQPLPCTSKSTDAGLSACASAPGGPGVVLQMSPRRHHESSLERVASQMMLQMQHMAASQQRVFEIFLNSSGQPNRLRSLASIVDGDFLEDRMRPGLPALPPPPLATVEEVTSPTFASRSPAAPVTPAREPGRSSAIAAATEARDGAPPEEDDVLEKMLDAMSARKRDKVAAAKIVAKAKPHSEAPGGGSSIVAASAGKPTKAASAKAKDKAAAEPLVALATPPMKRKAKAPATMDAGVPMAETPPSKPEAKVVAAMPAKKSTTAKAKSAAPKAKPRAKEIASDAKAKATASVAQLRGKAKVEAKAVAVGGDCVLGCAKRRFSWRGCGQCRAPDWTGFRWNPFVEE